MNKIQHFFTRPAFITQLTIVGWLAVVLLTGGPFRIGLSTAFLLTMPGYYAYRLIAGYNRMQSGWVTAAYSVGLSIATLIATSFVVNEAGVYTGHPQPLMRLPLALAVAAVTSIFAGISARHRPADFRLVWRRPADLVTKVTGLLLPLIAVAGAITLNNGGPNVLAVAGLAAVAVYFVAITWRNGDGSSYPYALYMMSLAILLGTSMRGWNITGHDVMQEYQVFQLTSQHSVWHMHFYQDAYNACLSITILPTLLQRLTGIADAYVYKFIFQLYFALTAPVLYLSLRRYVPKIMAMLAAFVFITFPTYITDITMLGRQETAFLFLALAILAGLDVSLGRVRRSALSFIFLSAMVLSHYSTSYVTLGILLLASLLGGGLSMWHRLKPRHNSRTPLVNMSVISAPVVIATLLVLIAWNTLATQTSNNISQTLAGILPSLPAVLHPAPAAPTLNSAQQVASYASTTEAARKLAPSAYYSSTITDAAPIVAATDTVDQPTALARKLHLNSDVMYKVFDQIKALYAKLIQALILLGLILFTVSKRFRYRLPTRYCLLGAASLAMIAAQVVLPSSVINYGLLRLIQQSLLVLALPIVAASFWLLGLVRLPRRMHHRAVGIALSIFFLVLAGVLPAITGSYKPALAVSNSGFYYEAYYTHQDEIDAAVWLKNNVPSGSQIYSDEFARRKIIAYTNVFSTSILVPGAIPIDSYVYLDDANVTTGKVAVYYGSDLIFYQVPTAFLTANKNLVYSSGNVRIYH